SIIVFSCGGDEDNIYIFDPITITYKILLDSTISKILLDLELVSTIYIGDSYNTSSIKQLSLTEDGELVAKIFLKVGYNFHNVVYSFY
ncbi:hypothetical protein, partial [Bacillus cereus group sp. BC307]|uniref:hypothetical protein n=1 Tax=Bacillus cereus group sp. BC307 TaxID=3445319 RepID=UPI003F24099E